MKRARAESSSEVDTGPTGKQGKERPAEIELRQLNPEHEKEEAPSRTQTSGPMKIDAMFRKPFLAIEQCNRSSSA